MINMTYDDAIDAMTAIIPDPITLSDQIMRYDIDPDDDNLDHRIRDIMIALDPTDSTIDDLIDDLTP
jgi:hypothetical protein